MSKRVITINRMLGSNGRLIGKALAEELGFAFYDKELIDIAAQKENIPFDLLALVRLPVGICHHLFCTGLFQYPVRVAGYDRFFSAAAFSHLWREQILLQPPLRTGSTVQQAGDRP